MAVPHDYSSIDEAARAYATGQINGEDFIAAAVALPTVMQAPMPDHWFDDWALKSGPLSDLQDALALRLITPALYDAALGAMIRAGHEA